MPSPPRADGSRVAVGVTVMAHPRRAEAAEALAERLGDATGIVYDPKPDGPPNPLRTALAAWSRCPDGTTHHLVVQDDVEPVPSLPAAAERAARRFPDAVLSLYANSVSSNGAASRVALLAGYTWVVAAADEYFPTLAVIAPCEVAHAFTAWCRTRPDPGSRGDDERLAEFLAPNGHPALLRVPNLVDHRELPSLAGNDHHGLRRSVCFADPAGRYRENGAEPVLWHPPNRPMFVLGESLLCDPVEGPLDRQAHLARVGVTWEQVMGMARELSPLPTPLPGRAPRALRFLRELCLACHTLGWAVAAAGPGPDGVLPDDATRDAALLSYLESGLDGDAQGELWTPHLATLMRFARHLYARGLTAVHEGVPAVPLP
ncbi:hypothetical protein [Rhizohabitans arisaemae]|uniref:hypothetical protein n=1 Tax=Rhizohabitans arisaemae TaxID=2720610 RepID=UPI0024B066A0|nr:hypothetical protein [Rhizohabitans arisaemae]